MRVLRFPRRVSRVRRALATITAGYLTLVAGLTILCLVNVTLLLALDLLGL